MFEATESSEPCSTRFCANSAGISGMASILPQSRLREPGRQQSLSPCPESVAGGYGVTTSRLALSESPTLTVVPAPYSAAVANVRPTDPKTPTFGVRSIETPVERSWRLGTARLESPGAK